MIAYTKIKKAIVSNLKGIKNIEVAFEELSKTKESEQLDEWFFVTLLPVTNRLNGATMRDRSFIIDIAYWHKSQKKKIYFELNEKLDEMFLPCFSVENRHITISEAEFKVVDDVAHYVFTLRFTDTVEHQDDGVLAKDLELDII